MCQVIYRPCCKTWRGDVFILISLVIWFNSVHCAYLLLFSLILTYILSYILSYITIQENKLRGQIYEPSRKLKAVNPWWWRDRLIFIWISIEKDYIVTWHYFICFKTIFALHVSSGGKSCLFNVSESWEGENGETSSKEIAKLVSSGKDQLCINSEIVIKDQSFNGKSMLQKLYVLYLYYSKV